MFGVLINGKHILSTSNYLSKGKCGVQQKLSGILASDDLRTYNKVKVLLSGGSVGCALVQTLP